MAFVFSVVAGAVEPRVYVVGTSVHKYKQDLVFLYIIIHIKHNEKDFLTELESFWDINFQISTQPRKLICLMWFDVIHFTYPHGVMELLGKVIIYNFYLFILFIYLFFFFWGGGGGEFSSMLLT